jgi:hypothetical protein
MLVNPESQFAIVDKNGRMTDEMFAWIEEATTRINNSEPIDGTGTPETSVVAAVGRWYVDKSAAVGSGIYYKELDNIGGDRSKGWVLRS